MGHQLPTPGPILLSDDSPLLAAPFGDSGEAADAARYRFLRNGWRHAPMDPFIASKGYGQITLHTGVDADQAIDKAIEAWMDRLDGEGNTQPVSPDPDAIALEAASQIYSLAVEFHFMPRVQAIARVQNIVRNALRKDGP